MTRFLQASVRLLALSLTLCTGALARPSREPRAASPDTDPFYQPPDGYETTEPGTILRQRRTVASFFGLIPDPVEAYQLLYRTTAIDGSAISTVTTVFKPLFAKKDRFVSFHTAYDSSSTTCSPSYDYQLGTVPTDLVSASETFLLQAYLLSGYIVASPDYEGPDAAFTPGRLEGMGVLDGMRAVANFKQTLGFSTNSPMAVGVGYSGGAIATGWAASLQPTYAPELTIKGWVQGGTPANLTGILVYIDNTLFSGFLPAAIDGLAKPSAYGQRLNPLLNSIVTPFGRSKLDFAASNCAVRNLLSFPEQSVLSPKFQSLGADLVYDSRLVPILDENIMGQKINETPTAPVLVYHASQDEIVPYSNASTLVDSWCAYGANVHFTTFANGGHVTTEIIALPDAIAFVAAAFAGTIASGCSRQSKLTSTLNPLALGAALEPISVKLIEALVTLGKNDANVIKDLNTLGKTIS